MRAFEMIFFGLLAAVILGLLLGAGAGFFGALFVGFIASVFLIAGTMALGQRRLFAAILCLGVFALLIMVIASGVLH
jgi:hypothetical protein